MYELEDFLLLCNINTAVPLSYIPLLLEFTCFCSVLLLLSTSFSYLTT